MNTYEQIGVMFYKMLRRESVVIACTELLHTVKI